MKKVTQGSRRSISCDILPSKTVRSSSFKCINGSKSSEKIDRYRTSRVRFKETVTSGIKSSQSVQFVRNTEQPVKKTRSVVSFTPGFQNKLTSVENLTDNKNKGSESDIHYQDDNLKLNAPELCTSLKVANKLLEEAASESKTALSKSSLKDAYSSEAIKSKVLRKVNIPFEEQIYKNLVDLKVTDDDLHYGQDKRVKSRHFERIKEKEPELSEFYKPAFNEEYVFKMEKLRIEPEKVIRYDGFSISDKMKTWELP